LGLVVIVGEIARGTRRPQLWNEIAIRAYLAFVHVPHLATVRFEAALEDDGLRNAGAAAGRIHLQPQPHLGAGTAIDVDDTHRVDGDAGCARTQRSRQPVAIDGIEFQWQRPDGSLCHGVVRSRGWTWTLSDL